MKRSIIFTLITLFGAMSALAEQPVSGKLEAEKDHSALEVATVRIYRMSESDSTLVGGTTTDMQGSYRLDGIPEGEYKVWYNMVGYHPASRTIQVANAPLQLPVMRLREMVTALGEVVVAGKAVEMTVKGDTLEYNTAAYQLGENASVEELLRRMNGVQVDAEGNVKVNGETITAVRIDGKKFFGSDVQAATKNIPAEMIERVQVIDEKSDMAKMTGIEDDETERIINLTLKPNRKKGVFGNYSLAAGADLVGIETGRWLGYTPRFMEEDFRYSGNLFTNFLLGESQTTIIGSAGNTNEIRTGRGRGMFSGQNEGITRAENVGVNTNIDLSSHLRHPQEGSSLLLGGDASMNHNRVQKQSQQDQTIYSTELTYHNTDSALSIGTGWDAKLRLELEYKANDKNKLIIKPEISYTQQENNGENTYAYERADERIKYGTQWKSSLSDNLQAGLQVLYSHGFARAGRVLSLDGKVSFSSTHSQSSTLAANFLLMRNDVDQHILSFSNSLNYSLKASWVEPLYSTHHFLETAVTIKGNHRTSEKNQESMDTTLAEPTYVYDPVYSNRMQTDFWQEIVEANYRLVQPDYDLTLGMQFHPSQTRSLSYYGETLARDTLIQAWNWSPNANFRYKFGKREFLRLRYRGQSTQPSVNQMEPVRNNSNSMQESVGNLGLNPAFNHRFFFTYSRYNQERMSSVMTGLNGGLTQHALVENTIYDQTGKRYSQTVNAEATPWNISANVMYNTPFANKWLQFHTRTSLGYNQRVAYILREQESGTIEEMIAGGQFLRGKPSYTGNLQAGEDLSLRLTHDWLDLGLNGQVNYNRTENSLTEVVNHTWNWTVKGDVGLHLKKDWNISLDCAYTSRYGYRLEGVNEVIFNAKVDKTWGNATLALEAKDLLHQQKNIVEVVTADAVTYKKFNTLPTYFLLTFTYKLNKMGDLKPSMNPEERMFGPRL